MTRRYWSKSVRNDPNGLGTTGRLGLGCGAFGREIDQDASFAIMDHAMELGITLFDTAEAYGGGEAKRYRQSRFGVDDTREVSHELHSSELIIGRWLRSRGIRREVILVTKAWENYTRVHLSEAAQCSLERLQTDYVDAYLFHRYCPATPLEEAVAALDNVVGAGLARAGGCSNFTFEQLTCALEIARRDRMRPLRVIEENYNLAVPGLAGKTLPLARSQGIHVLTYSPLGAGFLTGKYTPDRSSFPSGTRFDVIPGHADVYFSDRNFRIVDRLRDMSERVAVPVARLAMAWVLKNPSVNTVLVGARTTAHLDNAVAAIHMDLPQTWYDEMNSWS
jgi:aryl-alcohol dehydrogenase-like predicted oxidoreductase